MEKEADGREFMGLRNGCEMMIAVRVVVIAVTVVVVAVVISRATNWQIGEFEKERGGFVADGGWSGSWLLYSDGGGWAPSWLPVCKQWLA